MAEFKTTPGDSTTMPPGIPYIVGNEAAERFSFYGMKAILTVYMTEYMVDASGALDVMSKADAKYWFHMFVASAYIFPVIGALIADSVLGKYRTILYLSIIYCFGHLVLSIGDLPISPGGSGPYLAVGLILIAIGTGAIKPCVTAHVGDQFGPKNQHLLQKVYDLFYFSINFGACFSSLLTPWLLEKHGPEIAFGVPGLLMLIATIVFWKGRNTFVHIPAGGPKFIKESLSGVGLKAIARLIPIYCMIAFFWSLFDQTGSSWVLQAGNMDRELFGIEWGKAQIQFVNPAFVMLFIPLFSYGVYPLIDKVFPLTPLRKIGIGMFLAAVSFMVCAYIQSMIDKGQSPNIIWQIIAYAILTAGEIMVSITALEFSYTQAPKTMKSFIMSLNLASVALGNLFAAQVNSLVEYEGVKEYLAGANYFWFFVGTTLIASCVFVVLAKKYRGQEYFQGEADE